MIKPKYLVQKIDGEPIEPGAKYFVLRFDAGSSDIFARTALLHYCQLNQDPSGLDAFFQELWDELISESRKARAQNHD